MKYNQNNYQELANRFRVEELKERLEFNTAASAGWDKKTKVKGEVTADKKNGVGVKGTVETEVTWGKK
jgi:hypothetical protein